MKLWKRRQAEKGYLTWREYMEAVEEDRIKTGGINRTLTIK